MKTLNLTSVKLQSIVINRIDENGKTTGYVRNVNYAVIDDNGNEVMHNNSKKYTIGTSFSDSEKLSVDSNDLIVELVDNTLANMMIREGLDE